MAWLALFMDQGLGIFGVENYLDRRAKESRDRING